MLQPQASIASTCTLSKKHAIDQFPIDIEDLEGSERKVLLKAP